MLLTISQRENILYKFVIIIKLSLQTIILHNFINYYKFKVNKISKMRDSKIEGTEEISKF